MALPALAISSRCSSVRIRSSSLSLTSSGAFMVASLRSSSASFLSAQSFLILASISSRSAENG